MKKKIFAYAVLLFISFCCVAHVFLIHFKKQSESKLSLIVGFHSSPCTLPSNLPYDEMPLGNYCVLYDARLVTDSVEAANGQSTHIFGVVGTGMSMTNGNASNTSALDEACIKKLSDVLLKNVGFDQKTDHRVLQQALDVSSDYASSHNHLFNHGVIGLLRTHPNCAQGRLSLNINVGECCEIFKSGLLVFPPWRTSFIRPDDWTKSFTVSKGDLLILSNGCCMGNLNEVRCDLEKNPTVECANNIAKRVIQKHLAKNYYSEPAYVLLVYIA